MVNDTKRKRIPDQQRQAWLTEYRACEQESDSNAQSYWIMAGIFIGTSSAVLGWLLYSLISRPAENALNPALIPVTGGAMIAILIFLRLWLRRVNYLVDRNYERMREIELKLGMWKSWRIHIIDRWNKARRKLHLKLINDLSDDNIWNRIRKKLGFKTIDDLSDDNIDEIWQRTLKEYDLVRGLSEESLGLFAARQRELFEICYRCSLQRFYEKPSRILHFPPILYILIGLWVFFIVMGSFIVN